MADTKSSAEPSATTLVGTEKFDVLQDGVNKTATGSQITTLVNTLGFSAPLPFVSTGGATLYKNTPTGGDGTAFALVSGGAEAKTQGPTVEPNYFDTTWSWGINTAGAMIPIDAAKAVTQLTFESKFAQGGATDPFGAEFHLQHKPTVGGDQRMMSFFMPWDMSTTEAKIAHGVSFKANNTKFSDSNGTIWCQIQHTPSLYGYWDMGASERLRFAGNNYAIFQQRNAANNAYLSLPYFTSADTLLTTAPGGYTFNGARFAAANSFITFQPTTVLNAGDSVVTAKVGPSVTGAITVFNGVGTTTGELSNLLYQQNTGSGAHAVGSDMQLIAGGAGDLFHRARINSGQNWTWGLDNSDTFSWVISASGALGTSNKFKVAVNGEQLLYNVTTAPASPPSGAYALYIESGVLKAKNSAGAVTTLAS